MIVLRPEQAHTTVIIPLGDRELTLYSSYDPSYTEPWITGKPTNLLPMGEEFRIYRELYGNTGAIGMMATDFAIYTVTGWMRRTTESVKPRYTMNDVRSRIPDADYGRLVRALEFLTAKH
jgi:hypothetical protein